MDLDYKIAGRDVIIHRSWCTLADLVVDVPLADLRASYGDPDELTINRTVESVLMKLPLPIVVLATKKSARSVVKAGGEFLTPLLVYVNGMMAFTPSVFSRGTLEAYAGKRMKELTPKQKHEIRGLSLPTILLEGDDEDVEDVWLRMKELGGK